MERGKIATSLHFCQKKYRPNTFTSLVLWTAMLFLGDLTDFFSVTTLNCRYIGARAARGKIFDRYGLGNLGFGFRSSCGGWVLGFGAPVRAGFGVSGSGPETRVRGQV